MGNVHTISNETTAKITKERDIETNFYSLTNAFEEKLKAFDPINNAFELSEYFGPGNGAKGALRCLVRDFPQLRQAATNSNFEETPTDFSGLYVLIHGDRPFYVGISRKVVNRLNQHLKVANHFAASLAYKIAKINEGSDDANTSSKRQRAELETEKIKAAQSFLMQQRAAILPFNNHDEMYLFEVFVSMKYKTCLNTFETT